jgi:hypothetical protein
MKKVVENVVKKGRPVNVNSVRQIRLKELEMKKELGLLKRGRPVNENSERQKRLTELESKRNNGTLKLGRPKKVVVTDEVAA